MPMPANAHDDDDDDPEAGIAGETASPQQSELQTLEL